MPASSSGGALSTLRQLVVHNLGAELVDFNLDRLQVLPYRGDPRRPIAP
jgi:hypothetical protein